MPAHPSPAIPSNAVNAEEILEGGMSIFLSCENIGVKVGGVAVREKRASLEVSGLADLLDPLSVNVSMVSQS